MAKKSPVNKTPNLGRQLSSLERLVRRGFQQTKQRFGQVDKRFAQVDKRFGQIDKRFDQIDQRIERLDHRVAGIEIEMLASKREMKDQFTRMEESISHLANHVDGFMKLHGTIDIEMRVMKEPMKHFEDRLAHLEAAQAS